MYAYFPPKIIVDHDTTAEYESNTCIPKELAQKRMENLVQWAVDAFAEVDEESVTQLGVVVVTGLRLPELRPLVCSGIGIRCMPVLAKIKTTRC
jgi:site-specific recombinase XerC